jgi:hypothetical protein
LTQPGPFLERTTTARQTCERHHQQRDHVDCLPAGLVAWIGLLTGKTGGSAGASLEVER